MNPIPSEAALLPTLLARLERISADSHSAHLASGIRGALLRLQERLEAGRPVDVRAFARLVGQGFEVLKDAARQRSGG